MNSGFSKKFHCKSEATATFLYEIKRKILMILLYGILQNVFTHSSAGSIKKEKKNAVAKLPSLPSS